MSLPGLMRRLPWQVAHLTSELGELRLQLAEASGQSADRSARAEQELRSLRQQLGAATGQLMGRDQEVQMLQERLQVGKLGHPSLLSQLVCWCMHCASCTVPQGRCQRAMSELWDGGPSAYDSPQSMVCGSPCCTAASSWDSWPTAGLDGQAGRRQGTGS